MHIKQYRLLEESFLLELVAVAKTSWSWSAAFVDQLESRMYTAFMLEICDHRGHGNSRDNQDPGSTEPKPNSKNSRNSLNAGE